MLINWIKHRSVFIVFTVLSLSFGAHAQTTAEQAKSYATGLNSETERNPYQQFVVKMKQQDGASPTRAFVEQRLQTAARSAGVTLRYSRPLATGAHLIHVEGNLDRQSSDELMNSIASDPQVLYIEPDLLLKTQLVPNDPRFNEQWHLYETLAGINITEAWDFAGLSDVRVAVLDSGITDHPDVNANVIGGYDFISATPASLNSLYSAGDGDGRDADPTDEGDWRFIGDDCVGSQEYDSTWHGTHVAGTIAALTNNSTGVAGVAFGAKVVPIRVAGKCGILTSDLSDAIMWAYGGGVPAIPTNPDPADIINLSLSSNFEFPCPSIIQEAIDDAVINNTLVVTATGNNGVSADNYFPGNCLNVLNVAALDRQGNLAGYSNSGASISISAPGGNTGNGSADGLLSLSNTGQTTPGEPTYDFKVGTSRAAPLVSGIAALLLGADPSLSIHARKELEILFQKGVITKIVDPNKTTRKRAFNNWPKRLLLDFH